MSTYVEKINAAITRCDRNQVEASLQLSTIDAVMYLLRDGLNNEESRPKSEIPESPAEANARFEFFFEDVRAQVIDSVAKGIRGVDITLAK